MRILLCNYEYPPLGGGGGVVMAAMARELARRHEVTVLTSRMGDLPHESIEGGVRVVRTPVFFRKRLAVANLPSMLAYLPMGILSGRRLARRHCFDIINTHFAVPTGPVGDWLSRRLNIPNVLSVHGGDLYDPSKRISPHQYFLTRRLVAALPQRANAVVAQSRDTAGNLVQIYGVRRPHELVPLGIERPPAVSHCTRAEFGIPEEAFVLVSVGRMVARKATAQLVRMMAAAPDPALCLVIMGDGPEEPEVRRLARELGVASRIRFLGRVSEADKWRVLGLADAFVSTSQHEGFGLVFLEAMACGLPIVCYDHGGQTDFLKTPDTGHVVPLNDLAAFTAAVQELHRSPERRRAIRRHNLALVEEFFIDRCARRYETIFESVLRGGEVPAAARGGTVSPVLPLQPPRER